MQYEILYHHLCKEEKLNHPVAIGYTLSMHIACIALCPPTVIKVWLGSVSESLIQAGCGRCESFWAQPPREGRRSFVSAGREKYGGSCIHPFRTSVGKVGVRALVNLPKVVWTVSLWSKAPPLALTTLGMLIFFGTSMRKQPRSSSVPFMCGMPGSWTWRWE